MRIVLRELTSADMETVWRVNNDPDARAQSLSQAEIPWVEHQQWFTAALSDPKLAMWMIEVDGREVGVVRIAARGEHTWLMSVALAPAHRGRGLGSEAIALAAQRHREAHPGATLEAWVAVDNVASRRAFEKAGFAQRETRTVADGRAFVVYARRGG